jgi:hypothetical protein
MLLLYTNNNNNNNNNNNCFYDGYFIYMAITSMRPAFTHKFCHCAARSSSRCLPTSSSEVVLFVNK